LQAAGNNVVKMTTLFPRSEGKAIFGEAIGSIVLDRARADAVLFGEAIRRLSRRARIALLLFVLVCASSSLRFLRQLISAPPEQRQIQKPARRLFVGWRVAVCERSLIVRGTVRLIRLPETEPELPQAPGRETAQLYCGICHTTRYITIQPPLPRETWLAEVTKMRTTFSGPIPEE
jgi:hypothetical protein